MFNNKTNFSCLASLDNSSKKISEFSCSVPQIDPDVVKFVFKSNQQTSDFQKELSDLAKVEIASDAESSEHRIKVKPLPNAVSKYVPYLLYLYYTVIALHVHVPHTVHPHVLLIYFVER